MKYFIFIFFTISLFSQTYQCSGFGETKSEAKEEAKKSAIASSSTYLKSVFEKDISAKDGKNIRYTLQTIATGICKIESGKTSFSDDVFEFQGVCQVENESITQTEEILKRVSSLEQNRDMIFREIKNLQNKILDFSNGSDISDLKAQISELETRVENFPKTENIYYQISQNFKTTNIRISKISEKLEKTISDLENSQNRKIIEIQNRISDISDSLEKRVSILEKYQNYIFSALGGIGLILIFLLFRKPKQITIEKIADISVVSKKIKISTSKKVYFQNEKLEIEFSNHLEKEMFFYIIDINMRDETTLIYPSKKDNNLLSKNSSRKLGKIEIVSPFGKDILKIIASPVKLKIPKIIYEKKSKVFDNNRGFANPEIEKIEQNLADETEISDRDILAHFRGQALNGKFTIFENFVEVETRE